MKLQIAAACAVLSLAAGTAAFAEGRVSATLEQPTAARTKMIVAHSVFVCDGASCVSGAGNDEAETVRGCAALAKKVGRVSAYTTEKKSFDAEALATCNASAAGAPITATASN